MVQAAGKRRETPALAISPTGFVFAAGEAPDAGPYGTEDILLAKYNRFTRDFTFGNVTRLYGTMNPDFFEGTAVADACRRELAVTGSAVG